jgi:hypothetical protein
MARSGNSGAVQKAPEVTFNIELRPATSEQLEAGRRLFSRLMTRAQAAEDERAESARAGRRKPPPVQSPSLTNRGTLSSKEGCE